MIISISGDKYRFEVPTDADLELELAIMSSPSPPKQYPEALVESMKLLIRDDYPKNE